MTTSNVCSSPRCFLKRVRRATCSLVEPMNRGDAQGNAENATKCSAFMHKSASSLQNRHADLVSQHLYVADRRTQAPEQAALQKMIPLSGLSRSSNCECHFGGFPSFHFRFDKAAVTFSARQHMLETNAFFPVNLSTKSADLSVCSTAISTKHRGAARINSNRAERRVFQQAATVCRVRCAQPAPMSISHSRSPPEIRLQ